MISTVGNVTINSKEVTKKLLPNCVWFGNSDYERRTPEKDTVEISNNSEKKPNKKKIIIGAIVASLVTGYGIFVGKHWSKVKEVGLINFTKAFFVSLYQGARDIFQKTLDFFLNILNFIM